MSGGTGPSGLASSRFTASSLPSPAALSSQGVGSFPWTVLTCSAHPGQGGGAVGQEATERASHVRLQAVIVVLRVDSSCHYYKGHKWQDAASERESRGHSRFVGGKTAARR